MNTVWINCCIAVLFFLLPAVGSGQGKRYAERYAGECREALDFWELHKADFEVAAKKAGVSPRFLFAVVAPEVSQFGSLMNKAQTYTLKVLYAQNGKAYADFSIGMFQMKPSFVEQLEVCVGKDKTLLAEFPDVRLPADSRDTRVERIKRLDSLEWQMTYLTLFCRVVEWRFSNTSFATEEDKLRFYANAYNRGFHLSEERLRQEGKPYFPAFARQKFRYADVALWFYRNVQ